MFWARSVFEPNLTFLKPNMTWYAQVTVLVVGHVLALIVAHDRAVALSPSPKVALRTQYAMLTLMVIYTVGGMWLLSLDYGPSSATASMSGSSTVSGSQKRPPSRER